MDEKDIYRAGKDEGIELGVKQGENNQKIKIAKEMIKMGLSIEQIEKATKLTKEEIEKLK